MYKDTTILYRDSIEAALKANQGSAEDETADSEDVNYSTDTVLQSNQLVLERDSVRVLKNQKAFAYAKNLDSLLYHYQEGAKFKEGSERDISWIAQFFLSPVTKYFFILLGAGFVCFILYKLFFEEGFLQKSSARVRPAASADETDDLSQNADYAKLITQAIANRNYRLAVRYYYLQVLQKLASKGAIEFAPDKTNYEYVRELSGKKYKEAFAELTLNYDYVWYGEFEIDEQVFNAVQNKFRQFNNEV